jgi:ABC-type glycerol-3-phosphate transport system substrate-binding protein
MGGAMSTNRLSRREFLHMGALAAAGVGIGGCGRKRPSGSRESGPGKPVVLEIQATQPEYLNVHRQIWDVYEAENPGIKIKMFAVNEDTQGAYEAKLAGGYLPHIARVMGVDQNNYDRYLDLSTIGFPWFDRWTYDVKTVWSELYGLPGPRTLDPFQGFVFTWLYHQDLMDQAGLDPRRDVKTWDDLKRFLDEGTKWVEATPGIDHFWDLGWHIWAVFENYMDLIPLAFPDGSRQRQRDCWLGKAAFNAPDSPYRHTFEFFKEAYGKGWLPRRWWTREWETDMEASYIAKKSVLLLHGPWIWDKMLAASPGARQLGFPSTPPAEAGMKWRQFMGALPFDSGYCILDGVQKLPEWEEVKKAFFWLHSPKVIRMWAQAEGRVPMYGMDEPLGLKGPQYLGVLKEIGGALWPDVEYETSTVGRMAAAPYRKRGSEGLWNWWTHSYIDTFVGAMTGKISVKEALDVAQARWQESYEIPRVE